MHFTTIPKRQNAAAFKRPSHFSVAVAEWTRQTAMGGRNRFSIHHIKNNQSNISPEPVLISSSPPCTHPEEWCDELQQSRAQYTARATLVFSCVVSLLYYFQFNESSLWVATIAVSVWVDLSVLNLFLCKSKLSSLRFSSAKSFLCDFHPQQHSLKQMSQRGPNKNWLCAALGGTVALFVFFSVGWLDDCTSSPLAASAGPGRRLPEPAETQSRMDQITPRKSILHFLSSTYQHQRRGESELI